MLKIVHRCHENEVAIYVLGRGSNILVADEGLDGVVIQLSDDCFGQITINDNIVNTGAGASLSQLVRRCAEEGLSGMECMAGIPGTVGGAVKINAGGRFGDIGNVAQLVRVMDSSGYEFERKREDIYFGYRMTNIMAKLILEAEFSLVPDDPKRIGRLLKEVWMVKKNSQPLNTRNAGCVFKNPRGLSAGALVDRAGLKGLQIGKAQVSEKHANFIIAHKGCKASDVKRLIESIQQRVKEKSEIELELELEIW